MLEQTMTTETPLDTEGDHARRLNLITVIACLGGLLFGYDTGVINGALEPMKADLGMSPAIEGFVVSILIFAAAIGAVLGGRLADAHGRRHNILLLSLLFIAGTLGCVFAPSWQVLALFRAVLGLAVGGASAIVPIYLAEVSPHERRGSLVTRNEVMIVSGQFAAFVINALIYSFWGGHEDVWRWMLAIAVLPAIALMIGMLRMPESPRWLSMQDRNDEALEVLQQVRSPERAVAEMREVREMAAIDRQDPSTILADLAQPWVKRLIWIGIALGVFMQLTGINSIMYYGSQLLQDAGFSSRAAVIGNTLYGLASLAGILGGIMLINRLDRRTMLIGGFVLTTVFHLLVGLSAYFMPDVAAKPWVILCFTVLFVLAMQGTIGPLVWLILAEMFPLRVRSFAMGISVFALWITNATVAFAFPPLVAAVGIGATFFGFAVLGVIAIAFMAALVPETRGKTLEEFEQEMQARMS
ncbi:sugar porter family MFS transporter [Mangrovicoccus sp. HB161399]|uniref:sugar porter family MFS transporter n=1 Tax=Mangrovicoccus sp. HB161399 TaxID=2720392 RepID=UPI001553FF8D|nr:sugar porter family MFS transporter [Mangrovicoccus sp. HB161399]